MLEVCIDSLESALNAVHGGADELEICSSLAVGGLTPTAGLVKEIKLMVTKIGSGTCLYKTCTPSCICLRLTQKPKLNVMIRCRIGSDFCYSDHEMDTMLADVEVFNKMEVDRFVFGALTNLQDIDINNNARVIAKAYPIPVTFHRAYDVCKDPVDALSKILDIGFNRLLTSGQRSCASDVLALQLLQSLQTMFGKKIEIMPGAGVTVQNAKLFIEMGFKIVHSSCKRVRELPKIENNLCMGTNDSECILISDENIVRKLKEVLNS